MNTRLQTLLNPYSKNKKEKKIGDITFREGDRADTGHRALLIQLGFAERELLIEYGYPTQRFALSPTPKKENMP